MSDSDSSRGELIDDVNLALRGSRAHVSSPNLRPSEESPVRQLPERGQSSTTRRRDSSDLLGGVSASSRQVRPRNDARIEECNASPPKESAKGPPKAASFLAEIFEQQTTNSRRSPYGQNQTWTAVKTRPIPPLRSQLMRSSTFAPSRSGLRDQLTSQRSRVRGYIRRVDIRVTITLRHRPLSQNADSCLYHTPRPRGWAIDFQRIQLYPGFVNNRLPKGELTVALERS